MKLVLHNASPDKEAWRATLCREPEYMGTLRGCWEVLACAILVKMLADFSNEPVRFCWYEDCIPGNYP